MSLSATSTQDPPHCTQGPRAGNVACDRSHARVRLTPRHGSHEVSVDLPYLWFGARRGPTVIVQGGISAGRDACSSPAHTESGWWQALVGPGRAIDTDRVRVLAIDWLDGAQLGVDAITSEDQADAVAALLDCLGIDRVAAWIGASYGAMVGLAFAARHPARLDKLVALAGAHRPHPLASAQRAVQRGILALGREHGCEGRAVALARQLALTTYRGDREFGERFAGSAEQVDGRWQLPVESWLRHNGDKFVSCCDAARYASLSQSIDLHHIDPAQIYIPVRLIGFASDRLVPLADLCELQRSLAGQASLDVVDSRCGHDGFLVEHQRLAPLLTDALDLASSERVPEAITPTRTHPLATSA